MPLAQEGWLEREGCKGDAGCKVLCRARAFAQASESTLYAGHHAGRADVELAGAGIPAVPVADLWPDSSWLHAEVGDGAPVEVSALGGAHSELAPTKLKGNKTQGN